ncbi:hypothetical protein [Planktothrix mougeotii]|uniref:hypothetical protein n=1 Tax=Planktothrix mougeotii TaxID=54306 RepID=UPI0018822925|nr:hypothetical protein [Planktothrix mougeotii]
MIALFSDCDGVAAACRHRSPYNDHAEKPGFLTTISVEIQKLSEKPGFWFTFFNYYQKVRSLFALFTT